jgi:hypothetical protein
MEEHVATTGLLVEIVVVGFTFFLCLVPLVSAFRDLPLVSIVDWFGRVPVQYQLVAAYVAGIIWNGVCDQCFHVFDDCVIRSRFESRVTYQNARIEVVLESESMRQYLSSQRSILRVVRAFAVVALIYLLATPIYLVHIEPLASFVFAQQVEIMVFEGLLLMASFYAWYRLESGYVAAISDAHDAVRRKNAT